MNLKTKRRCTNCLNFGYWKDSRPKQPVCNNAGNFDYRDYRYKDIAARCVGYVFNPDQYHEQSF